MIARFLCTIIVLLSAIASVAASDPAPPPKAKADKAAFRTNRPVELVDNTKAKAKTDDTPKPTPTTNPSLIPDSDQVVRSFQTVGLFAMVSLAPAAVLMLTAFVRINIVLLLLRQALGSPQVPGNQVITALALMLTALVMKPLGETVYHDAIVPYTAKKIAWNDAYQRASGPVKTFMIDQIERSNHTDYLWDLYDQAIPETDSEGKPRPVPVYRDDFPMRVVAPAFLISEITTGLMIGFYLYLPFLVVDLVVSAVLAAMGLFMLPPALVALPLKLILFVMVDGWLHVAVKLLESFGPVSVVSSG